MSDTKRVNAFGASMIFQPLTLEGAKAVLPLRNRMAAALRTDAPVNEEDQEAWWYHATKRDANQRWWELRTADSFRGYCGIEGIDWIARTGELSILVDGTDDEWRGVFDRLHNLAFDELNLKEVHAEVYHSSPDRHRWLEAAHVFGVRPITLPMRKFSGGRMWDADYLSWRLPV